MARDRNTAPPANAYLKGEIALRVRGGSARLRVSQSLFSSHDIDAGTRLLLRSLDGLRPGEPISVLDLGCGYGPIGIALKIAEPKRLVRVIDRDALAVEYARQNIALNGLTGIEAGGGLGFDDLARAQFDVIAMNIPAKAGAPVIAHLLLGGSRHLKPGGTVAVVVVAALAASVRTVLASEPAITITHERSSSGHAVMHYGFSGAPTAPVAPDASAAGVYDRGETSVALNGRGHPLTTVFGLPEFDAPSFETQLLMQEIRETRDAGAPHVAVLNPGQGYVPMLLAACVPLSRITLVGRDLLALRCSTANLARSDMPPEHIDIVHAVGFPALHDAATTIVGVLRDDEGIDAIAETVEHAASSLLRDGTLLLAASSTTGSRLEKRFRAQRSPAIKEMRRKKGNVVLQIRRRS